MSNKRKDDGEFDWEEYDMITSGRSPYSGPGSAPERGSFDEIGYDSDYDDEALSRRSRRQPSPRAQRSGHNKRPSGGTRRTNTGGQNSGRQTKKTPKKRRKKQLTDKQRRFRRRLGAFIAVAAAILIVVTTSIGIGMYAAVSREIKDMNIRNLALDSTSFIYYNDVYGTEQELEKIQTAENRIWLNSDQIPQVMKDAMVSIEDERFYTHHGVDLKRTAGATAGYILSKFGIGSASYGGSTITQQVIKNITNEKEATPTRKIKEMMRAVALENELSKDEILTLYLNIVCFANGCNGVEAASNVYFAKHASELTLPEAASIAGITQFPSQFDPYVHPDKNIEKRNTVLSKMRDLGYITEEEYATASASDLIVDNSYVENGTHISSYFVDQVITDVISDLQTRRGYSAEFAEQQVYNGGLKIYSTVDINIQQTLEDVFYSADVFPYTDTNAQSAMIIIDPYTGQTKGLIGGLGQKTDVRGFNRATQARRQPGSSLKPLSVYGPAVDLGKITEVTNVTDEEITVGSDNWKPKNSYDDFYGDMTIREAVGRSANIPAVRVLDEYVGLSTSFGYLQNKFHIDNLSDDDKNYPSLSLGGLTNGVSPKEMAAAYCVFVNSGKYIEPYTYTRVVDSTGQTILENTSDSTQSISAAAAYIMTDLLSAPVNDRYGTGKAAKLDNDMPTYGKTGTTDDDFDKWFVGFTPYYVGAVWYGFDNPSSITQAGVSGNPCVTAWNTVMDRIHSGLAPKELERPTNVVEATVCTRSGMLATSGCNAVSSYFVDGTQPKSLCNGTHASGSAYGSSDDDDEDESSSSGGSLVQPQTQPETSYGSNSSPSADSSGSSSSGSSGSADSSGSSSSGSSGSVDSSGSQDSADSSGSQGLGGSSGSDGSDGSSGSDGSDGSSGSDGSTIYEENETENTTGNNTGGTHIADDNQTETQNEGPGENVTDSEDGGE